MCLRLHDVNSFDLKMKLGKGPPLHCNLIVFSLWKASRAERGQGYMYTLCQLVLRGCAPTPSRSPPSTHTLSPQHAPALPGCPAPRPRVHAEPEMRLQPALHLPKTFLPGGVPRSCSEASFKVRFPFPHQRAHELQPHHCLFPEVGFQMYPWRKKRQTQTDSTR